VSDAKRKAVAAELGRDASRSDRAIARALGVSPTLVGSVRRAGALPSAPPSMRSMDIERLSERVAKLADRVAALEAAAAASMDTSSVSTPSMDSRAAYKAISALLPRLRGEQRALLRNRLRLRWR